MLVKKPLVIANVLSITIADINTLSNPYTDNINAIIAELDTCINNHMIKAVGPLIMKTSLFQNDNNESQLLVTYLQQVDSFINDLNDPYKIEETIDIPECIYVKYEGPQKDLISAFQEVQALSKENGISLLNEIYTVFISNDLETDKTVTELFFPIDEQKK